MKTAEKRMQLERVLYQRALAGRKGRGGETVPHPTKDENEELINIMASLLIDLEAKVKALEEKTTLLFLFRIQFAKFCKNFVQKLNYNSLTFGALLALFAHTAIKVGIIKRFLTNRC